MKNKSDSCSLDRTNYVPFSEKRSAAVIAKLVNITVE